MSNFLIISILCIEIQVTSLDKRSPREISLPTPAPSNIIEVGSINQTDTWTEIEMEQQKMERDGLSRDGRDGDSDVYDVE